MRFSSVAVVGIIGIWATGAFAMNVTGNPSNDKILPLGMKDQAKLLARATQGRCTGRSAYYMGLGDSPNKDVAFWTLNCTDGSSYLIAIAPDAIGSTKVIDCSTAKKLHLAHCLKED